MLLLLMTSLKTIRDSIALYSLDQLCRSVRSLRKLTWSITLTDLLCRVTPIRGDRI